VLASLDFVDQHTLNVDQQGLNDSGSYDVGYAEFAAKGTFGGCKLQLSLADKQVRAH
jgi:hypothetical protein